MKWKFAVILMVLCLCFAGRLLLEATIKSLGPIYFFAFPLVPLLHEALVCVAIALLRKLPKAIVITLLVSTLVPEMFVMIIGGLVGSRLFGFLCILLLWVLKRSLYVSNSRPNESITA